MIYAYEQFSICTVFMDLKALETLTVRSIGWKTRRENEELKNWREVKINAFDDVL
jgi:hypothetical protein